MREPGALHIVAQVVQPSPGRRPSAPRLLSQPSRLVISLLLRRIALPERRVFLPDALGEVVAVGAVQRRFNLWLERPQRRLLAAGEACAGGDSC